MTLSRFEPVDDKLIPSNPLFISESERGSLLDTDEADEAEDEAEDEEDEDEESSLTRRTEELRPMV